MTSTPADRFAVLADKAEIYKPDTLNYACAANVDLANWCMQNRALILSALRAGDGWQDIAKDWVLVPREPTPEMKLALLTEYEKYPTIIPNPKAAAWDTLCGYRAMIAAAPASSGIGETK